jgi:serine/threonine protein kinase
VTCRDDAGAWYRGRAGTAAYWCREMLVRGADGERLPYGYGADWFSFGCLVFCLMTGRSPFSSGLGTAYDNQLTTEGRVTFPKGLFSREARDLITRLLAPEPAGRLGSGDQGWAAVQAHPWFASVDWALLEARVLPPRE